MSQKTAISLSQQALAVATFLLMTGMSFAETAAPTPTPTTTASAGEDYCSNFVDAAAEARAALQLNLIGDAKAELEAQLSDVKKATAELETWIEKREAMLALATKELVKIYSNVEPEAAAQQMEKIDLRMTASILRRLNAKRAGEILSVMDVSKAATVMKLMTVDSDAGASKS